MSGRLSTYPSAQRNRPYCALVAGGKMTNETLRGRLSIAASNYSIASRIISDTIAAGLIKLEDSSKSRKYAQYIPIWA